VITAADLGKHASYIVSRLYVQSTIVSCIKSHAAGGVRGVLTSPSQCAADASVVSDIDR